MLRCRCRRPPHSAALFTPQRSLASHPSATGPLCPVSSSHLSLAGMSDPSPAPRVDDAKGEPVAPLDHAAAASPPAPTASTPLAPPSSASVNGTALSPPELGLSNLFACSFPDELTRHILQLLQPFAHTPHLELEGKLGRCVMHGGGQKKPLFSALLDCLLPLDGAQSQHTFDASVHQREFRHINDGLMKGRFEREQEDSRRERRPARLSYAHPVTVDLFYATQPQPTRVSVDTATASRTCIHKRKMTSLDFLSPPLATPPNALAAAAAAMPPSIDFRLSLSQEIPAPPPPSSSEPFRMRRKDRRSYAGEWWQVDCTVVESWNSVKRDASTEVGWAGEGKAAVSYEVGRELAGGAVRRVKEEALKAAGGRDNALLDIARNLLDNIRSLSILATRPLPPSSKKRNRDEMEERKE